MPVRHSLRVRVAVAFALFGGAVSLALAAGIYLVFQDLEQRLIDETLTAELEDYIARRSRNPHSLPEATATIRAYVIAPDGGTRSVPRPLLDLEPGRHRVVLGGTVYRAAVKPVERQRFVVLYNESRLIERERTFLALLVGAAVLMVGLSAVAGSWLARRMTAPVTDLVKRVAGLRPEDAPDSLESEFEWDEVRELAHDFDIYLERLRAFIQRERLFTGDISHELRTPLAVSSGAVQILLSDEDLPGAARERVGRIARAMREMQEITDALLALAREQDQGTAATEPCDVAQVMEDVLAKQRELFRDKPVEVELELAGSPVVPAERPLLAVVLGNLLRNAFAYTDRGRINVRLDACCVRIEDTGPGIAPEDRERVFRPYYRGARSSGAGLGLSLVRRICERYGWSIDLGPTASGGTRAELRFTGRRPPI